ncbi:MAG: hypothetical protein ACODAQ_02835 [Phycisphaeraceae bacterium]
MRGRVPNGYWRVRANRVRYMQWLRQRLGIRKPDDWYCLKRQHFLDNYGGGLLATIYHHSPLAALRDYMPNHPWKPWLLTSSPQRFWHDRRNRIWYMDWLGQQLGFETIEDWHQLSQQDFHDHHGTGLLGMYYGNSPLRALKDYKPRVKWREWEFGAVTQGFWQKRENRIRYMNWLGEQLGFRKAEDWYHVTRRHFRENRGEPMLRAYPEALPIHALREYMPDVDWKEWLFHRVPNGFWHEDRNRRRYMRWLGRVLEFRRPNDWYRLSQRHVRLTGGGALLNMRYNNCLADMLAEHFPQREWYVDRLNATHDGELTQRLIERDLVRQYAA